MLTSLFGPPDKVSPVPMGLLSPKQVMQKIHKNNEG